MAAAETLARHKTFDVFDIILVELPNAANSGFAHLGTGRGHGDWCAAVR